MKHRHLMLFLLCICVISGIILHCPKLTAKTAKNPIDAAFLLNEALKTEKTELTYREYIEDFDLFYSALESVYPYAFTLGMISRANGVTTISVENSRPARQKLGNDFAEQLAKEIVSPDMTDEEKLRALHDELIRLCVYDSETAKEGTDGTHEAFAADGALLSHKAVCSGYGRAYVMLCKAAGIENIIYITSEEMNHGFNAVRLNGETFYIDCTFDDPVPDRGEYVSDEFFLKTAEEMRETHRWNEAFYEQILDYIAAI